MLNNALSQASVTCSDSDAALASVVPSGLVAFAVSIVENVYMCAQHRCLSGEPLVTKIVRYDDLNADEEYYALNKNNWFEIENHAIDENRIGVGREYSDKETVIFIKIGSEGKTTTCKNYVLFSRNDWIELRQSRGENKYKKMKISPNGTVWVGKKYKLCKLRVFIKI